ncbi:MAG TPA: diguanylate cyclase [Pyrinomonadaceae bacterium]|nr:diguanylate cyclase [Pyrinomonadaceae bacterium]
MKKKPPKEKAAIAQEVIERAPAGWAEVQEKVAAGAGLSVLLVDGYQPPALVVSNNNSICHAFQSSPEYVKLCDPYCGQAHQRALKAGAAINYKCHAGLSCIAMPLEVGDEENLAVIGGRAFVTGADYRATVERFREGDLQELLAKDPFHNVIFSEPAKLEELAGRLALAAGKFTETEIEPEAPAAVAVAEQKSRDAASVRQEPEKLNARTLEMQRELDQLRGELEQRSQLNESLQHFLERINATDPQQTYAAILKNSKELLLAERASLFAFEESSNELVAKGVIGFPVEISEISHIRVGEGIAGQVMESGTALVEADLESAGFRAAETERGYKTNSFISYPLVLAGRKIGVLNVADKIGRGAYDDVDLSLIDIIGPQIATALERAGWQERASEFRLMSVTDAGTGLLNRRYLEERLNEELNRSRRYNYSMSFLMIDIDDFKNYNDVNGHPAGDQALKITAHGLKSELRLEDVACRYGGEEFCILLPQTPINEAAAIAERIRRKIADTAYPYGANQPAGRVTISIGISTLSRHVDTSAAIIDAADRALYDAKRKGKNRIEFYQQSPGTSSDSIESPDERQ